MLFEYVLTGDSRATPKSKRNHVAVDRILVVTAFAIRW